MIEIFSITNGHEFWNDTIAFAESCNGRLYAGKYYSIQ